MPTSREHFALDWIKSDLLETLNEARTSLDDYAEMADETRMRACLTGLHQVHGTLVMLELKGVTQLADHLEQLAQAMLAGQITDPTASGQALMQGILELPGYLDELQRGGEDSASVSIDLVNEIRGMLGLEALNDGAGANLSEGASDEVIARFNAIGGPEKVARMRSAYQNVLLSILKGDDRAQAVGVLKKIATGLQKVTEGAALAGQWQAFGEFVTSLSYQQGVLESEAVKLLRRVDVEIKNLAKDGEAALRQPVNMELIQQLLDAAEARDHSSEAVTDLREAVSRDAGSNNTLAISGRQALSSAAGALQEDLALVKDKMDLLVRAPSVDLEELRALINPLKQIGSTLSLLGFESSREIVSDQVDAIESLIVLGDGDPQGVQSIAGALVQIDENLTSVIQGSGQTEVEQITGEAQLQVLREARKGLEVVKQAIVDFVTTQWSVNHLEVVPSTLNEICGALGIVPLPRAINMLQSINAYVTDELMQGRQPDWQELDQFADVVSAVDYYLERLGEESSSGTEDILQVAERSLAELSTSSGQVAEAPAEAVVDVQEEAQVEAAAEAPAEIETPEAATPESEAPEVEAPEVEAPEMEAPGPAVEAVEEDASAEPEMAADAQAAEAEAEEEEVDFTAAPEEPKLRREHDDTFDLASDTFAGIDEKALEDSVPEDSATDEALEAEASDLVEDATEEAPEAPDWDLVAQDDSAAADETLETVADDTPELEAESEASPVADDLVATPDESLELAQEAEEAPAEDAEAELPPIEFSMDAADDVESADVEDTFASEDEAAAQEEEAPVEASVEAESADHPDPEIVEIFVEEVGEVLENVDEYLPLWAQSLAVDESLTEVRRAFHTLKGSGRIVQAAEIGELAWGIENMLNRVIDGTVAATSQFVDVINEARDLIPALRDAFEQRQAVDLDAMSVIIDRADVLASGGTLDEAPVAAAPEAPALEDAGEVIEAQADAEREAVEEATADDIPSIEDLADLVAEDDAEVVAETEDAAELPDFELADADLDEVMGDSSLALFKGEAEEHLAVLAAENARVPWTLSEPMARAFHTLAGSAAMAGIQEMQLIVEPAYQVVEAFRGQSPSTELQAFFQEAEKHLKECLAALSGELEGEWEEPLEFVARADDLMAAGSAKPRPIDQLLDAKVTAAIFEAEAEVNAYLSGQTETSVDLQAMLNELAEVARDLNAAPLAELSTALAEAMATAAIAQHMPPTCAVVMQQAYEQLIDQLNEIAAGSEVAEQTELVAELQSLDFSPVAVVAEPADDEAPVEAQDAVVEAEAEEEAVEEPQAIEAQPATADEESADALVEEIANLTEVDPDLVQVFFEEAEEINEDLEANIVNWSSERENRLYMENLLRGLHTLKGGARLCGLSRLGDQAHDFESLVIEVQSNEREVDDALFTELHKRFDAITAHLAEINKQLDMSEAGTAPAAAAPEQPAEVVEMPAAEPEAPAAEVASAVSDVNKIVEAVTAPAEPAAAPAQRQDEDKPQAPAVERQNQEMVRVGSGLLEELVNLAGESSILRARIEQGMSDFTSALDEMETTIERLREQLRRLEIETETQILHRHERTDGPQYENFDPLEMDRYNQLQQLSRGLSESASDMLDLKETLLYKARESETLLLQQARINTELQEGLMRTRMVPFSRLLPRLRRIVRQVSGELNKEVEFHVQNAEGELDRNLLERMVPPLEHMLRNAVDHGIESTEMRRNFGKSANGRIDLRLTREGGDVVIEISDDGAGIDVESVRAKAIERELMAPNADLTEEEILQFVLAPGFSTAKSVTQISGRGVGLDVVHSEVKQLGGSINIVSRPGKGTRFVVRVPFTVSVNRALMVSVGDDLYAIPLNTIEGIVLLSPDQLQALYTGEGKSFEYAGIPYRVRYLGQYLGREFSRVAAGQASVPMVLVRSGDHAVAIHVDQVQGSREIVVKSLGPQFAGVGGISGATILGDGSVVVILDLLALIRAQHLQSGRRAKPAQPSRRGPRCVMVVDDSVTVRKVTSRLLERQGMDVLVAKDGIEAVALLQERRPDIMLLDIEMPRMDGFEVARQVRHDERLGNLPIVMISSRTGDKHKEHASQLGVNKFLGKPFQENELLATIDELVTRD